jgi:hypothetical protein
MEPYFLSLYSILGCLEEILQVLNRDDSKNTSSGCFSILLLSNLSPWGQVCFYLITFNKKEHAFHMFKQHITFRD